MGLDIVKRLRMWAEDDLRGIAQDAPVMGLKIEPKELRMWAALMDEAAVEIERLRQIVDQPPSGLSAPFTRRDLRNATEST